MPKPLWYLDRWHSAEIGTVVLVPLRTRVIPALVIGKAAQLKLDYQVRELVTVEKSPFDKHYIGFIRQIAQYYQIQPVAILKLLYRFIVQRNKKNSVESKHQFEAHFNQLSSDQEQVYQQILPAILHPKFQATVLHGVTGSGKTEVYKALIRSAYQQGKTTILLLPEVAMALRFEQLMIKTLGQIPVLSFHSLTLTEDKRRLWEMLSTDQPVLIIGVHLPILLPITNLGLIIIDEEHATGYQQQSHPRLNSKELALLRAKKYQIPIVLGSATPAISSLYNLQRSDWQLVSLPQRFAGAFPKIKLVQLGEKRQPHFLVSHELASALQICLERQEQAIIFLNRRGYSFFVQCQSCQFVFQCPNCSVSLTLHQDGVMRCHYCEFECIEPKKCSVCQSNKLLKRGVGTQQVVTILQKLFPRAVIARADLDTTSQKRSWQKTLQDLEDQKIDILVGTQLITKGYHFPKVTLVGILWADLSLNLPLFNAAETTLQQILQVAGRAGRQSADSTVIVQSFVQHPIFNYLNEKAYLDFYNSEIKKRQITQYPPLIRLAEVELTGSNEDIVELEAQQVYQFFDSLRHKHNQSISILGPVKPTVAKIRQTYMRKIFLKSDDIKSLITLFTQLDLSKFSSRIFFTPNPLS